MKGKIKKCPKCGWVISKEFFSQCPSCPGCGSMETRRVRKKYLYCRAWGYEAHFRQFFEGQRERIEVQKLFKKGIIEGKEFIDWRKLEEEEKKRRKKIID